MATPTRFSNGITTVRKDNVLGMFGLPDPTEWIVFWEDFDKSQFNNITDTTTWDITNTGTGTIALTDVLGGCLLLTNAAADNDALFVQKKGECFKFTAGKKVFFKARFKVSDATESDFIIGLQITDTTPLDVTDGVFFQKDDDDALLDFHVEKNNTATDKTAIATVVSDTFLEVGFYYDGVSEITYFVDGVKKGTAAVTNLVDDEELTVSFGIQNGEAVAKTMTVDYILAAQER